MNMPEDKAPQVSCFGNQFQTDSPTRKNWSDGDFALRRWVLMKWMWYLTKELLSVPVLKAHVFQISVFLSQ